jgi:hypothetical protein
VLKCTHCSNLYKNTQLILISILMLNIIYEFYNDKFYVSVNAMHSFLQSITMVKMVHYVTYEILETLLTPVFLDWLTL